MKRVKVLILDDEVDMAHTISDMLEFVIDKLETRVAHNASDAMKLVSDHQFDCIISDIQLPGIDGLSFIRQLRELGYDIPIVLTSGHSDVELRNLAKEVGVSYFISKPFDLNSVSHILLSSMGRQAS